MNKKDKNKKRIRLLLLTFTLLLSIQLTTLAAEPEIKYIDIQNHHAYESIQEAVQRGWMTGITEEKFSPNQPITRGVFVNALEALITKSKKQTAMVYQSPFADAANNSVYGKALGWATHTGIVSGVGNDLFLPERFITYEELITMVYRAYQIHNPEPIVEDIPFEHEDATAEWAIIPIRWAIQSELADPSVYPSELVKRANVATLFSQYTQRFGSTIESSKLGKLVAQSSTPERHILAYNQDGSWQIEEQPASTISKKKTTIKQ